mmetsp:Transcript_9456/g.57704  ORF Transcript_9456/g.57704 Transcript_9456/m.57704 type:complete len:390 (-) Transcript_9456:3576-4745(-)
MASTPTVKRVRVCVASSIVQSPDTPSLHEQDTQWIGYWCVLPAECRTVGDWEDRIRKEVLRCQNDEPLELSINGYILPLTESLNIVREDDVVYVSNLHIPDQNDITEETDGPTEFPSPPQLQHSYQLTPSLPSKPFLTGTVEDIAGKVVKNSRSARRKAMKRRYRREAKAQENAWPGNRQGDSMDGQNNKDSILNRIEVDCGQSSQQLTERHGPHAGNTLAGYGTNLDSHSPNTPRAGDMLHFRMLELSDTWEPLISERKVATVVTYDQSTGTVHVELSTNPMERSSDTLPERFLHFKLSKLYDVAIQRSNKIIPIITNSEDTADAGKIRNLADIDALSPGSKETHSERIDRKVEERSETTNTHSKKASCRGSGALWPALQFLRDSGHI